MEYNPATAVAEGGPLARVERFGGRVDYARERAILSRDVVERAVALARAQDPAWQRSFGYAAQGYSVGGDGSCPFYYREDASPGGSGGGPRAATEADCIEAFKIVEACGVAGTTAPLVDRVDTARSRGSTLTVWRCCCD